MRLSVLGFRLLDPVSFVELPDGAVAVSTRLGLRLRGKRADCSRIIHEDALAKDRVSVLANANDHPGGIFLTPMQPRVALPRRLPAECGWKPPAPVTAQRTLGALGSIKDALGGGNQRQLHRDAGSSPGLTLNARDASQQFCPAANSLQTESPRRKSARGQSDSPVLNLNGEHTAVQRQTDQNIAALAVTAGVGQALLDDPKRHQFHRR